MKLQKKSTGNMMKNEVFFSNEANKSLEKIKKSNPKQHLKIIEFVIILENSENPRALPNAKSLKGFENKYRWRLGDYRIIGNIEKNEFHIVEIVKIDKRDDKTYKNL